MKLYLAYQSAVDYWSYYDLASRAQIVKTWDTAFGSPTRELVSDAQLERPIFSFRFMLWFVVKIIKGTFQKSPVIQSGKPFLSVRL